MAKVLKLSQSCHFSSHSSSSSSSSSSSFGGNDCIRDPHGLVEEEEEERSDKEGERSEISSTLEILVSAIRKSLIGGCVGEEDLCSMEIGVPTDVRHIAHVTFDRFHGFLGLPVEFEPEVPRRAPSASATVFGVSTESMQLSYDTRGNVVPTILLMMQNHLYTKGGLQVEGIFRINGENAQEEYIREELNRGIIPENIDVHCLASLIKAWFRELPSGVLDLLTPEQVMESQSEEECMNLVRLLPSTESALLNWSINLMADVVEFEHLNKMNSRNIAMVFAPNMTQMLDPLTALMYVVQVMNFLKTLIEKTVKDREESRANLVVEDLPGPRDNNGDESNGRQLLYLMKTNKDEDFDVEIKGKEEVEEEEEEEEMKSLVKSCCYKNGSVREKQQRMMMNYRVELLEAWR